MEKKEVERNHYRFPILFTLYIVFSYILWMTSSMLD